MSVMSANHQNFPPNQQNFAPFPPTQQQAPAPKKKKKWLPWVLVGVGAVIVINAVSAGGGTDNTASAPTEIAAVAAQPKDAAPVEAVEPPREVSAQMMLDDLESNALAAASQYKDKRVTVSGFVGNIDASGKYFAIDPKPDAFVLTGIQARPKTAEHEDALIALSQDAPITVTGTVTGVGEILGYSISVETIH